MRQRVEHDPDGAPAGRSAVQELTFVTGKTPGFAGVDPYNDYIDRDSADNVLPVASSGAVKHEEASLRAESPAS
jgi:hypothetical protein